MSSFLAPRRHAKALNYLRETLHDVANSCERFGGEEGSFTSALVQHSFCTAMGIQLENIHPISDFVRNYTAHADHIEKTSHVEILTRGGRPSLAVMPALAYEKLLEAQDFLETIESIEEGLAATARGESRPVEEFFSELTAL